MSIRRKKDAKTGTEKTVSYGFVGRFVSPRGHLGWSLPFAISGLNNGADGPSDSEFSIHEPHYLCRITVELVVDSRGRPIVRYPGGKRGDRDD